MNNVVIKQSSEVLAFEQALVQGNLASLTPEQRVSYYNHTCESLGLNPLTKPFEYITLNGKLTLYAKRDCTDQLRKVHNVSVVIVSRERMDDLLVVTSRATLPNGRTDESIGAVSISGLKGEALANAMLKAETKAKRRVTLSICGLGLLDESETSSIPSAQVHTPKPTPIAQVTSFAPGRDPVIDAVILEPKAKPWEKPVSKPAAVSELKPTEHELASFVIPGGVHKGIKLGDKPDAFWMQYRVELKENIKNIPEDRQAIAQDTIDAISIYLERA